MAKRPSSVRSRRHPRPSDPPGCRRAGGGELTPPSSHGGTGPGWRPRRRDSLQPRVTAIRRRTSTMAAYSSASWARLRPTCRRRSAWARGRPRSGRPGRHRSRRSSRGRSGRRGPGRSSAGPHPGTAPVAPRVASKAASISRSSSFSRLARRGADPADGRRSLLTLTARGDKVLAAAHQTRQEVVGAALAGWSAETVTPSPGCRARSSPAGSGQPAAGPGRRHGAGHCVAARVPIASKGCSRSDAKEADMTVVLLGTVPVPASVRELIQS
jgi:hypothetical protein